jgi:hypothetical protein
MRRNRCSGHSIMGGLLIVLLALGALPVAAQSMDDEETAAATAVELSRLETEGNFDALYDRMHPDARAIIPREAVVGWHVNEFAPRGPQVSTILGVITVPWTWEVTGQIYWNTAIVLYEQRFADGSVDRSQVHLVKSDQGEWGWFFGRSRAWVNDQIAKYVQSPTLAHTPTPAVLDSQRDDGSGLEIEVASLSTSVAELEDENEVLRTRVAELEARPVQTPTSTPLATRTVTRTPTPPVNSGMSDSSSYPELADVRELEVRPESLLNRKMRFIGTVHTTDGLTLDLGDGPVQSDLGVVVEAGDGTHRAVAITTTSIPEGASEGDQVEVLGTFRGTAFRENGNSVEIAVPFVQADQLVVMRPGPSADEYRLYFQPQPESIDERLDNLRLAGERIEFTCQIFNLVESGGAASPGDHTDATYNASMQVYVLGPDDILIDGDLHGEGFRVATNFGIAGVYDDTWLRVWGTIVDESSYYNKDMIILSTPLVRADRIEILPGPPAGTEDLAN